jgi:hypothetical protein
MLSSEKSTINGVTYEVTQLPYKLGHRLLLRLYKVLGPAVAKALSQAPGLDKGIAGLDTRELAPAFSAAVETLAETMTEEDFDFAVDTLAEYTKISKEADKWLPLKGAMEFHFAGNYPELFKWLGFALRVNYGGFFGEQGFGALLGRLQRTASKSPSTSTGTSTGSPAPSATAPG